jgi:hypothetical protein
MVPLVKIWSKSWAAFDKNPEAAANFIKQNMQLMRRD